MKHCVYLSPTTEAELKWIKEQPETKDIDLGLLLKIAISSIKETTLTEQKKEIYS